MKERKNCFVEVFENFCERCEWRHADWMWIHIPYDEEITISLPLLEKYLVWVSESEQAEDRACRLTNVKNAISRITGYVTETQRRKVGVAMDKLYEAQEALRECGFNRQDYCDKRETVRKRLGQVVDAWTQFKSNDVDTAPRKPSCYGDNKWEKNRFGEWK